MAIVDVVATDLKGKKMSAVEQVLVEFEDRLKTAGRQADFASYLEVLEAYEASLADAILADSLAEDSAVEAMVLERDGVEL